MMTSGLIAFPISPGSRSAAVFSPQDRLSGRASEEAVKILIVEDDFLAASEVEAVLTEAGYQVAGIANRAEEALRLAKSQSPDLAIMDIRLVGRADGVDAALEMFRETGVRCIFATAHHDARMRSRAQAAAPLGWLPKPYAPHALIAMVKQALAEL
jgi:DNA-binding NarL/FixJ family response regulator